MLSIKVHCSCQTGDEGGGRLYKHWRVTRSTAAAPPLHKIKHKFSGGSLNSAHLFTSTKSKSEVEKEQPSVLRTTVPSLSALVANMW